jgi:hypothetical protein
MKQETIYDSINEDEGMRISGLGNEDILEIGEICEFCDQEEITEVYDAKRLAREKSVNCLFKEIRGIDSTNPI